MRRLIAPAALLAVLALAGCAGSPSAQTTMSPDEFHKRVLELASYKNLDPTAADDLGKTVCDGLAKAKDAAARKQIADYIVSMQEDDHKGGGQDAVVFVDASIDRFCPELSLK